MEELKKKQNTLQKENPRIKELINRPPSTPNSNRGGRRYGYGMGILLSFNRVSVYESSWGTLYFTLNYYNPIYVSDCKEIMS